MKYKRIKKILLIRLRSLGDLVVITPCTRAVKQSYPDSELAVLVEKGMEDIFSENPYVDDIVIFDKKEGSVLSQIRFLLTLFRKSFDMVINLHGGPRSCVMTLCSSASYRVGGLQKKHHFNWVFNVRVAPFEEILGKGGKKDHIVNRHLATLKCAGIECDDNSLILNVSQEDIVSADQLLSSGGVNINCMAVIHCRAPGKTKKMSKERIVDIADALVKAFNLSIVFTGGAEDAEFYDEVISKMKNEACNLTGQTSVGQLAAICKGALFFLGVDSGPAHVAAGTGTHTISLFGSTNVNVWHPWTDKGIIIRKNFECIGCGKRECKYGDIPKCLEDITPDEIIDAIKRNELLNKNIQSVNRLF